MSEVRPATVSAVDETPVERELAGDMARRAVFLAPVVVLVAGAIWGLDGGLSAAYGLALVTANFALSAVMLGWAGRRSWAALMGAALFGYVVRLALIAVAVLAVKDQAWVQLLPLGLTLIVTHLGLLVWETRHISATLAFPGLKPDQRRS